MKVFGYKKSLPLTDPEFLQEYEKEIPVVTGRDLLIEIKGIAINPVDAKVRKRAEPPVGEIKILGWDASGIVVATGPDVSLFKKGDEVWYAGAINRSGCNAEFQLVDERIVSKKPKSFTFGEAAAMPLTSITAWELLFERLQIKKNESEAILIIGAAGGVGSMIIQLVKALTNLKIIATASRPDSKKWAKKLGADLVIDHHQNFQSQISANGFNKIKYIAALTHTGEHFSQIAEVIQPQGKICLIDDPKEPLDLSLVKWKSVSIHWEFMFTRSFHQTPDLIEQHKLLKKVAKLIDDGKIICTANNFLGKINLKNLQKAHRLIESETTIGKIALENFEGNSSQK